MTLEACGVVTYSSTIIRLHACGQTDIRDSGVSVPVFHTTFMQQQLLSKYFTFWWLETDHKPLPTNFYDTLKVSSVKFKSPWCAFLCHFYLITCGLICLSHFERQNLVLKVSEAGKTAELAFRYKLLRGLTASLFSYGWQVNNATQCSRHVVLPDSALHSTAKQFWIKSIDCIHVTSGD
jgi:hypothetical protein